MNNFLRHLHSRYTTSPAEIAAVVARVTPASIVRQERIVRGYDNEVHIVTTGDETRLVVRIRRRGEVSALDEAWAIERARAAGAPVPQVLLCERLWIDGGEREVMVQSALAGRPLAEIASTLGKEQLRACLSQAGAALVAIHTVAVGGLYRLHDGAWDFPSWERVAASNLRDRASEREAALGLGFTGAEFETLIAALDRLQSIFPWERPVLLHGDFTPSHLLFDDALALPGIVDFGDFQGGSPMTDLVELLVHTERWPLHEHSCVEWLRLGYGPALIWEHFAERRLMHEIGHAIGSLNYHVSMGDSASAAQFAPRLRRLLAEIGSNPILS